MSLRVRQRGITVAAAAFIVIVLDQLHKWWMLEQLGMATRDPIELLPFFRLVMVWNQGVSFGMLTHDVSYMRWFLIAVALFICAVMLRLGLRSDLKLERIGYGMVIGGALGNVVDRLRFGAVADFFHFHVGSFSWPAFNVADSAICLGVILLLWMMTFHPQKP